MATAWIVLVPNSTMEDVGDKAGGRETTVVVAGVTYKTDSPNPADDATEAKDLGGPGVQVKIEVDTVSREILKISTKKTF